MQKKTGRKTISFILTLAMVFSMLTGIMPGTSLTAYADDTIEGSGTQESPFIIKSEVDISKDNDAKTAAKSELAAYRNSFDDSDYDEDGVIELNKAKNDGDTAIDAAATDEEIAAALKTAKENIDKVYTKDQKAANYVISLIDALPEPVEITWKNIGDYQNDMRFAEQAFNRLTDNQRALINDDRQKKLEGMYIAETVADTINRLTNTIIWERNYKNDALYDEYGIAELDAIKDKYLDEAKSLQWEGTRESAQEIIDTEQEISINVRKELNAVDTISQKNAKAELEAKYDAMKNSGDYDEEGLDELKDAYDTAVAAIDEATVSDTKDDPKENGAWQAEQEGEEALDAVKTKEEKDKEAADAVSEIISKLPSNGNVAATDKDTIEKARKAYDALTDDQKEHVSEDVLKKLTDDETSIKTTPTEKFTTKKASDEKAKDGKISGLDSSKKYQYSSDGGKTWKDVTGVKAIDVMPGTYLLRYAGDDNTVPGAYVEVKVEVEQLKSVDMYRLYNPNSGEHFYTANKAERDMLTELGWRYEGIGWKAPEKSNTPVYRLYNPNAGDHHYTVNVNERDWLVSLGWRYEGIGWYSDDNKSVPLYRQYNPNEIAGTHNYTTNKAENDMLVNLGWRGEGIGWYGVK